MNLQQVPAIEKGMKIAEHYLETQPKHSLEPTEKPNVPVQ